VQGFDEQRAQLSSFHFQFFDISCCSSQFCTCQFVARRRCRHHAAIWNRFLFVVRAPADTFALFSRLCPCDFLERRFPRCRRGFLMLRSQAHRPRPVPDGTNSPGSGPGTETMCESTFRCPEQRGCRTTLKVCASWCTAKGDLEAVSSSTRRVRASPRVWNLLWSISSNAFPHVPCAILSRSMDPSASVCDLACAGRGPKIDLTGPGFDGTRFVSPGDIEREQSGAQRIRDLEITVVRPQPDPDLGTNRREPS
jgi:hypothetical protein